MLQNYRELRKTDQDQQIGIAIFQKYKIYKTVLESEVVYMHINRGNSAITSKPYCLCSLRWWERTWKFLKQSSIESKEKMLNVLCIPNR